jgi:hypothetical protein
MVALQAERTPPFATYRCPAGYSVHLSWTEGLVDITQDFLRKLEAETCGTEVTVQGSPAHKTTDGIAQMRITSSIIITAPHVT